MRGATGARLAAGLLAILGVSGPVSAAETVTVKGSDTLVVLVQRWAEGFMRRHPDVEVQVTGGGSGTGAAALLNHTTDLAMLSHPLRAEERAQLQQRTGHAPVEWAVARDGVTFYVNAKNPLDTLSLRQLRALYLGEVADWRELGGAARRVALYSRESSSGTYAFVKERLLDAEDFAVQVQTLPGTAAVVTAVAHDAGAIGYGGAAFSRGVKEVRLRLDDGTVVSAAETGLRDGRYPLKRELYLSAREAPPPGAVRDFVAYALSAEGQAQVRALGYYEIRPGSRSAEGGPSAPLRTVREPGFQPGDR